MPLTYAYGHVFSLLATIHGVPEDKFTALRGRIQHFQKLGMLKGRGSGRGHPAKYSPVEVLNLVLAFEVASIGLTPDRAVRIVQQAQREVASSVLYIIKTLGNEPTSAVYLALDPPFDLSDPTGGPDKTELLSVMSPGGLQDYLDQVPPQTHIRLALFKVTSLVIVMARHGAEQERVELLGDLVAWGTSVVTEKG